MRSRRNPCPAFFLLALLVAGCGGGQQAEAPKAPAEPETPPDVYTVKFETSKGDFTIEVHREWAPLGADQFHYLVRQGFYDGSRFFRVVRGFVVQFGVNGDPKLQSLYGQMKIRDDPVVQSNKTGFVSFAKLGPNSRTTQVFINLRDNTSLDKEGFAPFGQVVEGMNNVERLWSSYGEMAPRGSGPDPTRIETEGEPYLVREFPRLDKILHARVQPVANPI